MNFLDTVLRFLCVACPKIIWGVAMVVLNILVMPLLGKEGFGAYAIAQTLVLFLSEGLLGAAVDLGVLRYASLHWPSDNERASGVERAALHWKLCFAACTGICTLVLAGQISEWLFHSRHQQQLVWSIWAAANGMLLHGSALVYLQSRCRFVQFGLFDLAQVLVKVIGIVATILYWRYGGHSGSELSPAYVLSWFAVGPWFAFFAFYFSPIGRPLRKAAVDARSQHELLHVAGWNLATFSLTALGSRIDIFFLTSLGTLSEVSRFAAAQTLALIPQLLGTYIGVVMSPQIMPRYTAGTFRPLLARSQVTLGAVGGLMLALGWWGTNAVIAGIMPDTFADAAPVVRVLLPSAVASFTTFPLIVAFLMFVRPRFIISMEIVLLPLVAAAHAWAIPRWGAVGAAFVTSIFIIGKSIAAWLIAFRWADRAR